MIIIRRGKYVVIFIALLPIILICTIGNVASTISDFSDDLKHQYREKVKSMFYHAYNGYLEHAYPKDELKPITCEGQDTWGTYSLTLVDSLDMLLILGNATEFERATELVIGNMDLSRNMNVSVFETNIRIIGGLLSAHMLSSHAQNMLPDGWPCSGPLLDLAEKFAQKLLPAFNTNTGMPYGTVNLKYGVNYMETPITCTAGIGTFLLEFGTLSRLTGNPHFERVALKALDSLWASRSKLGLVGNHIDVQTGVYTATDAGIGAGVDSYFEYLVKGALLFQRPNLMKQFYEYEEAINKHVRKDDWFMWVDKDKATVSLPIFQSLEAFWPGLLTMIGKVEDAARIMASYGQVLRHLGLPPEFYNLPNREPVKNRAAYPLRPEIPESLMYLYRATRDPAYLQMAMGIVDVIDQMARTKCGFATVRDVTTWTLEDRMESFFLAETVKYLYLIFDEHNFIHNDGTRAKVVETTDGPCVIEAGGWIFNTEAHPLDPGIIYCCSKKRTKDNAMLQEFEDNIDLLSLIGHFDDDLMTPINSGQEEDQTSSGHINQKFDKHKGQQSMPEMMDKRKGEQKQQQQLKERLKTLEIPSQGTKAEKMAAITKAILNIFEKAELKVLGVNEKKLSSITPPKDEDAAKKDEIQVLCPDCSTLADEPAIGQAAKQFWLAIYANYFHHFTTTSNGPVCWDIQEESPPDDANDESSQYSNNMPDFDLLQSDSQKLDAVEAFSLRKFKYLRPSGWDDEEDFTLLTSQNAPFERLFMGIGQVVPVPVR